MNSPTGTDREAGNQASPFVIRSMEPGDEGYVYETWLSDLREADASFLPNDLWFPAHREVLSRVLAHPLTQAVVLADSVDPTIIYGYLIRDPEYLHWVHIRRGKWRHQNLAKQLLQATKSESLPLVWRTKLGHERLRNPLRSRLARHAWWSTASQSKASSGS